MSLWSSSSSSSIICSRVLIVASACAEERQPEKEIIAAGMKLELLLLMSVLKWCSGIRLSPLENNDKLQDITNLYVAEWQWESWPIKQDLPEQEGRSPSQRKNVALWKDGSGSAWYLFGGQPVDGDPKKVFSDVWKFTVRTRTWKRLLPSQAEVKGTYKNRTGGIVSTEAGVSHERSADFFERPLQSTVLCGGIEKSNPVKVKKLKAWSGFRRKTEAEETEDRLATLAVYAARPAKCSAVWQIDAKSKIWTPHVCCCDTIENKTENAASNVSKSLGNRDKMSHSGRGVEKSSNAARDECCVLDSKINKAEDEVDNEQQHLKMDNVRNRKKKINQIKIGSDKFHQKKLQIEKKRSDRTERKADETKLPPPEEGSKVSENKTIEEVNNVKVKNTTLKEEGTLKVKIEPSVKAQEVNMASKDCPQYSGSGTSVTWCDGKSEAIITSEISSPRMTFWVFNLSTGYWSQSQVKIPNGVDWPACANTTSVRYAGNDVNVYIICSKEFMTTSDSHTSSQDSTDPSQMPPKVSFNQKFVFRINYKESTLHDLGSIRLNPYFNSPEGEKVWKNESQAVFQIIGSEENETVLLLAYLDMVDLWVLDKDHEGRESFHLVEKIWRGSALKWFDKYNSALYSLQFVAESGNSETILLQNPREIGVNEYWPRERGRFIIRVFRNENLKNQTFENRTREQNLTYELLQSEYKPPGSENQFNHVYTLKVLVFFGISLTIFSVVGVVLFLKRCVNCPPRIRVRNECHKSPLIIRYSVIPDDLLYPVA